MASLIHWKESPLFSGNELPKWLTGSNLWLEVSVGSTERVRMILSDPQNRAEMRENEAIRIASAKGHLEIVRLLLSDFGVDPTAEGNEAIRLACENGHVEIVHFLLLDSRIKESSWIWSNSAIDAANSNHHENVMQILLSNHCVFMGCSLPTLYKYHSRVSPMLVEKWMRNRKDFVGVSYPKDYYSIFTKYLPHDLYALVIEYAFGG